jgi:carboxypeptidase T
MIVLLFIFTIDARYHTLDEIAIELDTLAAAYPDIMRCDTIGYSSTENLPIFAAKISDNVLQNEDEPELLYIGCHHAEEILGIEICMYMINDLLTKYGSDSAVTYWVNNREIWFVPLFNPEGHGVVMSGMDTTWRKNKRDNNNNGIFELAYDGVDLNRNYAFYFEYGGGDDPTQEYYRGPGPFSETETQAMSEFCFAHNFTFAITYHSARTGLGEVVYFPWLSSIIDAPDFFAVRTIAITLSQIIINDQGGGHYTAIAGAGVDGRARNWLYGVCGIFTYCIEVSTTTIQPGWMVDDICQRNLVGAYYLLERLDRGGITGHVHDAETGEPMSAEVIVHDMYSPLLPPRMSDPLHGRFLRMLDPGSYTIEVRTQDYESQFFENIVVSDTLIELDAHLKRIEGTINMIAPDQDLTVFPNPAQNILTIRLKDPAQYSSLRIYDMTGRLMRTYETPDNDIVWLGTDAMNRRLSNGVYYIAAYNGDRILTKKAVFLNDQ